MRLQRMCAALAGVAGLALGATPLAAAPATRAAPVASADPAALAALRARPAEDEILYFLLPDRFDNGDPSNDRGGLVGGRETTGFDPTDPGFYHGGDLKGLERRLDYIKGLGATAVWIGPVFKNKPVQGSGAHMSAAYHGYWITDFTRVDPHFGTNADFAALVKAAHARGLKVYLDIVINHTADVIRYRECDAGPCPYRSRADYPYQARGGVTGPRINAGFTGDTELTAANFARLTSPDYAYTPYVPAGEAHEKVPDWLNDPIYYHNRGSMGSSPESMTMGDFGGLDDVFTENPRVLAGFIQIYGDWIDRYGIDGYRIDTARHVNPGFWRAFIPAIQARAKADGIPHFHIFGEVADAAMNPGGLARYTRADHLPAVLDFSFARAVYDTVAGDKPTSELADLFAGDVLYEGGEAGARKLATFIGNHDAGRFGFFVRQQNPHIGDAELLQRVILGHAMLLTLRGVPVIYYGDEQGFAGQGGDRAARQDMFASRTPSYVAERLIGTGETGSRSHFETDGPLYRAIAELAHLRTSHRALTEGRQITRAAEDKPGLFAVSRFDPDTGREILIAFNTSTAPIRRNVQVEVASTRFAALHGACPAQPTAPGSLALVLPPLGFAICAAEPAA